MKAFYPNCEKETKQNFVDKIEDIDIRREMITVHLEHYRCEECGEVFEIARFDSDSLDVAYLEYRR